MRTLECPHESDVVLAVRTGRWPARVDDTLRQHAGNCAICSDAVAIASAIVSAEAADDEAGPVPGAGAVWLRMQMRARADAARAAHRTMTVTQVVAVGAAAAAGGAVFGATSAWFRAWIEHMWRAVAGATASMSVPVSITTLVGEHLLLATVVAALVVATPVALLLAERMDRKSA